MNMWLLNCLPKTALRLIPVTLDDVSWPTCAPKGAWSTNGRTGGKKTDSGSGVQTAVLRTLTKKKKQKLRKLLRPEKRLKAPALLILVPHIHVPQCTKRTGTQTIGWNFFYFILFFIFGSCDFLFPFRCCWMIAPDWKKKMPQAAVFFHLRPPPHPDFISILSHPPPPPISLPYFKH